MGNQEQEDDKHHGRYGSSDGETSGRKGDKRVL